MANHETTFIVAELQILLSMLNGMAPDASVAEVNAVLAKVENGAK